MSHSFPTFSGFGSFFSKPTDPKSFIDKFSSLHVDDDGDDITIVDKNNNPNTHTTDQPFSKNFNHNQNKKPITNPNDKDENENNIAVVYDAKNENNFVHLNRHLHYLGSVNDKNKSNDSKNKSDSSPPNEHKKKKNITKICHIYKNGSNVYQEGSCKIKNKYDSINNNFSDGATGNIYEKVQAQQVVNVPNTMPPLSEWAKYPPHIHGTYIQLMAANKSNITMQIPPQ